MSKQTTNEGIRLTKEGLDNAAYGAMPGEQDGGAMTVSISMPGKNISVTTDSADEIGQILKLAGIDVGAPSAVDPVQSVEDPVSYIGVGSEGEPSVPEHPTVDAPCDMSTGAEATGPELAVMVNPLQLELEMIKKLAGIQTPVVNSETPALAGEEAPATDDEEENAVKEEPNDPAFDKDPSNQFGASAVLGDEYEEEQDWHDKDGNVDPNGAHDAGGHYDAERDADKGDDRVKEATDAGEEDDADQWYDKDGNVDANGHYDAGGHYYAERAADEDQYNKDVSETIARLTQLSGIQESKWLAKGIVGEAKDKVPNAFSKDYKSEIPKKPGELTGHDSKKISTGTVYTKKHGKDVKESNKPDFLDIDKDGDKKEDFKKAVKDKVVKEVSESERILQLALGEGRFANAPDGAKGEPEYYGSLPSAPGKGAGDKEFGQNRAPGQGENPMGESTIEEQFATAMGEYRKFVAESIATMNEGKVKELSMDMRELSPQAFKAKYKATKAEMSDNSRKPVTPADKAKPVTEATTTEYGVFQTGGSVGEKNDKPTKTFDSKEDAQAYAKRCNAALSKGEKGYYGLKYVVRAIKEDVSESEELNELSPKTLGSYVKKAAGDAKSLGYNAGAADWGGDEGPGKHPSKKSWAGSASDDKAHSRLKGVSRAVDKLTAK